MHISRIKTKKIILKKISSKKGFTLIELMCSTLIMVIVAGIMVLGISLGSKTYNESVTSSGAKELCSIACDTLHDELSESGIIYTNNKTLVGVNSKSFGGGTDKDLKTFFIGSDGKLYYGNSTSSVRVLGDKSYRNNVKLEMVISLSTDTTKKSNIFTVTLKVKNSQGATLASSTFDVKQLNFHSPIDISSLT